MKDLVKMKLFILMTSLNLFYFAKCIDFRVDPLVLIDQGLVRGQKADDGSYSKFLGIPYARVDAANPFGESLQVEEFKSVFYANDGSIACPQRDQGSLDCLRLNVFVPNEASSYNPLPVLVWIHDGSFEINKAPDSNVLNIVNHGIILVTINYRLGPYGFMCLDVPSVPGNQGLKDQLTALRWVKNSIAAFGGNPYQITLGGFGVGGTSVNHHLYSSAEKIFNKAIIQSCVAQTPGLFVNGDHEAAVKLSRHLGYNTTDTESALAFLTTTSPELVVAATTELNLNFRPCKELSFSGIQNFIDTDPYNQENMNKIRNTPILVGTTSKEYLADSSLTLNVIGEELSTVFNFDEEESATAVSHVTHFYLGDVEDGDLSTELSNFKSDFVYNHPVEREISKLLAQNAAPIYEYVFGFAKDGTEEAGHRDFLKYLFGENVSLDEEAAAIAVKMGSLLANFVINGNPTPETNELLPVSWEAVTSDSRPYLYIDRELSLKHRFNHQRMAFWDVFYENYSKNNKISQRCNIL